MILQSTSLTKIKIIIEQAIDFPVKAFKRMPRRCERGLHGFSLYGQSGLIFGHDEFLLSYLEPSFSNETKSELC